MRKTSMKKNPLADIQDTYKWWYVTWCQFLSLNYKFNVIHTEILIELFKFINKLTLKFMGWNTQDNLGGIKRWKGKTYPIDVLSYKVAIKFVWCWLRNRQIDQRNGTEREPRNRLLNHENFAYAKCGISSHQKDY